MLPEPAYYAKFFHELFRAHIENQKYASYGAITCNLKHLCVILGNDKNGKR